MHLCLLRRRVDSEDTKSSSPLNSCLRWLQGAKRRWEMLRMSQEAWTWYDSVKHWTAHSTQRATTAKKMSWMPGDQRRRGQRAGGIRDNVVPPLKWDHWLTGTVLSKHFLSMTRWHAWLGTALWFCRWEEIFPKKPMDRLRWLYKACKASAGSWWVLVSLHDLFLMRRQPRRVE